VDDHGSTIRAVRAVDTATDPEYQGQGIFTRLTLAALDELRDEDVEMVFNTPNEKSLPGYLKMGWLVVGRPRVSIMPTQARSLATLAGARVPASRSGVLVHAGLAAEAAFANANDGDLRALIDSAPRRRGITTKRSPDFYRWRYGFAPLHYRVLTAGESVAGGFVAFHLRRRGGAIEAVMCDMRTPGGDHSIERALHRRVARVAGVDYLIRLDHRLLTTDPFLRLPRIGPILAVRRLTGYAPPPLARWNVTMGDIELF
jgi:hypothetical protein